MGIRLLICGMLFVIVTISPIAAQSPTSGTADLPACTKPQIPDDHNFSVFFDPHSAEIMKRGAGILDELLEDGRGDGIRVVVRGATDASETSHADAGLATRRGEAVRDYLVKGGLWPHAISIDMAGSIPPLVPTAPGVAEPQNRRAEVLPIGLGQAARSRDRSACVEWMRLRCIPASDADKANCYAALDWLKH